MCCGWTRIYQTEQRTYSWIWCKAATRRINPRDNRSWKRITENNMAKKAVNRIVGQKASPFSCRKISRNRKGQQVKFKINNSSIQVKGINTMLLISGNATSQLSRATRAVAVASAATSRTTSWTKCITRSATSRPKHRTDSLDTKWYG